MSIVLTPASSPTFIPGRYQVVLYGGTPTVQISPDNGTTWIGLNSILGTAVTGSNVNFLVEIGVGLAVRVTGTGSVMFARVPAVSTNAI